MNSYLPISLIPLSPFLTRCNPPNLHLLSAKTHLQTTILLVREDASSVTEDASTVTEDASTVREDSSTVTEDSSSVTEDACSVTEDASTVREDSSLVREAASTVRKITRRYRRVIFSAPRTDPEGRLGTPSPYCHSSTCSAIIASPPDIYFTVTFTVWLLLAVSVSPETVETVPVMR